ncbi:MAG TPA: nuclear transport factor 2 family protein [Mycobacteriales bacterium]|nr:nuclear transport factor 2 family protein [Mycobacteriales bacterium]
MIEQVVAKWHAFLEGNGSLDDLLADDVVFYSPIVFTPQRGKDVTTMYLHAAAQVLPGNDADGRFHYTKQVLCGSEAVLEFETTLSGKYVNGVDIITCDDSGRIVEFRVMIRPLQAVNAVHEQMKAMLDSMAG